MIVKLCQARYIKYLQSYCVTVIQEKTVLTYVTLVCWWVIFHNNNDDDGNGDKDDDDNNYNNNSDNYNNNINNNNYQTLCRHRPLL